MSDAATPKAEVSLPSFTSYDPTQLTAAQFLLLKRMGTVADILIKWAAKDPPKLGNATPSYLVDQLAYLKWVKKQTEAIEKTLVVVFKQKTNNAAGDTRGDEAIAKMTAPNFHVLSQAKVKAYCEANSLDVELFMEDQTRPTLNVNFF